MKNLDTEDIELGLLLEGIYLKYGYDFRNYSRTHIKRRVLRRLALSGMNSICEVLRRVLESKEFFEILLRDFSISVTEMFRDPTFYRGLRKEAMPVLQTYPFIKIWVAGCATGEEVYSLAILLQEEGLYERCQIYATDYNENVLKIAEKGIYPIENVDSYASNYIDGGGTEELADYYTSAYDSVIFHHKLKERVIFADHNLVSDGIFGEMHMIICRNVLIYFDKELQSKVLNLFYESLIHGGILCLGSKESLRTSNHEDRFIPLDIKERILQRSFCEIYKNAIKD